MANNWTREETILAFNLYCKIPFGRIDMKNPEIIALANRINRTPSAVSFKLANLARLDPALKQRNIAGASHGSKLDVEVWNEFHKDWDKMAYESEILLGESHTDTYIQEDIDLSQMPKGETRNSIVRTRINQSFFRASVLTAYDNKCCITGIPMNSLLIASHIVPWARDIENRTNPKNGLCLNALHDKAFDQGLITVTSHYKIRVSSKLEKHALTPAIKDFFVKYRNAKICAPTRFSPDKKFLEYHNDAIFQP
jgi:putative restriction endonuclease